MKADCPYFPSCIKITGTKKKERKKERGKSRQRQREREGEREEDRRFQDRI